MSDIHVDATHHLKSLLSSFVYTPAYTCSHILTNEHDPHHYDVVRLHEIVQLLEARKNQMLSTREKKKEKEKEKERKSNKKRRSKRETVGIKEGLRGHLKGFRGISDFFVGFLFDKGF